jgi:hydrogenase nickel incorporation protein HypA/HybF
MHEASAVESILRIASAEASAHGAARVTKIRLIVGEATGYMEESLAFFLEAMAKGGPVEGAELEIEYVKTGLRCSSCGEEFDRVGSSFACPKCGERAVLTGSGAEFYVDSIEIEEGK